MASRGGENSPLLKAATNEWALLAFRSVVTLLGIAGTVIGSLIMLGVSDIRSATADVKREVADLRVTVAANRLEDANRLGRVEGQVSELRGSVDAHRRRLDNNDADVRSIWTRIYDLTVAHPKAPP